MPGVFPLNDFSQPNAHGCLPRDLLTAPFTPPSLSPHHLFNLRLYATPQNRTSSTPDISPLHSARVLLLPLCTYPQSQLVMVAACR